MMTKLVKSVIGGILALCLINGPVFAKHHSESNTTNPTTTNNNTMVTLKTNFGDIEIELNASKAPKTVENFLQYVKDGHYDGVIFHRVISNFMVQGGGFDADMKEKKSRGPIPNEASNGLTNEKYTLAMARTNEPHSASAQFFINTKANDFLNFTSETQNGWGYAVFGKVVGGTEIVDKIEAVKTGQVGPYGDVPMEPVIIESATITE
ncbi:MAG: peptidyl-prolyl cis-trans isomerase B (cyclophilin B) [Arenicella sp.]|jgi:peptidyl-prolyl cis-trans isomerase B (cyclophilin B)